VVSGRPSASTPAGWRGFQPRFRAFAVYDPHHGRRGIRAAELRSYRDSPGPAQPGADVYDEDLVVGGFIVDHQVAEGVAVKPETM
jgi:hypothetical protein